MTLLVGISNPETAGELLGLAQRIARVEPSRILLTHVVTVASQISLSTGRSSPEVIQARDFLREVMDDARNTGVDAQAVVEVARSVEDGLLSAADRHDVHRILVGYTGRRPQGERRPRTPDGQGRVEDESDDPDLHEAEDRFDRTMQRVARKASADVIVAKFRRPGRRRILVPLAAEAPLALTGLLCRALTADDESAGPDPRITFLHAAQSTESAAPIENRLRERLDEEGLSSTGLRVVTSDAPFEDVVVEEANAHDILILGPSGRPGLLDTIFSSQAKRIAERVSASVILAWGPS